MRNGPAARAAVVVGSLLLFGIALRLLVAILQPVLPQPLMHDLNAGWNLLYSIVEPAMPAIAAIAILAAVCWVAAAWWRRR